MRKTAKQGVSRGKAETCLQIVENMADKAFLVPEVAGRIRVRPGSIQPIDGSEGQPMRMRDFDEGAMAHLQRGGTLVAVKKDQNAFGGSGLRHLDTVGAIFNGAGDSVAAIGSLNRERRQNKCSDSRNTFKTHLLASSVKPSNSSTVFVNARQFSGASRFRERRMPHV
nr:hypothetical protein [Pararhizobium antarcticum]